MSQEKGLFSKAEILALRDKMRNQKRQNNPVPPKKLVNVTSDLLAKQAVVTMTQSVQSALKAYDCPECGTDALNAHRLTCSRRPRPIGDPKPTSTYEEASPAMQDALRRAYRLNRVVNEQIGVMVNVSHGMGHGVPDEEVLRQAKRRLYKDARKPHPSPDGRILRPWGKPSIVLSRDMHPLNGTTIVVSAKWPKSVDLSKPQPKIYTADRSADPLDGLPLPLPYPQTVCSCAPCRDWHTTPESKGGCFEGEAGHGKCEDTWDQECVCSGTAADGECEGCWLWLK